MDERDTPDSGPEPTVGTTETYGRARRRLMMTLAAGGGAFAAANVLPKEWTRPIVNSIVVPAHAQASLAIGTFTTLSLQGSIFDYLVQPLHAAVPIGTVVVGNASFMASWDVLEEGYFLCGKGSVGGVVPFELEGKGGRAGNSLNDFSQSITGGTLSLVGQTVGPDSVTFTATYGASKTGASAFSGEGCGNINGTITLRRSSPYPDTDLA